MSGLFISYRRDDTQGFAGRLAHDLGRVFGPDRVFSDIEIPYGCDFGDVLHRAIAASDALLVVIGRRWAADTGDGSPGRLFDADDWVRTEIEAALSQGKVVVPVLVGGAVMPPAAALPDSIRHLARIQAASFEDRHWDADLASLVARLRAMLPALGETADQTPSQASAGGANDSLAQVLREIAERVLDEARAPRMPSPPENRRTGLARALLQPLWRALARMAKITLVLALIYVGVRLFGDDSLLRQLDAIESRLAIAGQRLLAYVGMR
ncbi:MAG: TIR domain-containing protein [Azoarcus sp.]|nr:TIR domain-containing protein [Azoarcus sp.]